MKRNVWIRGRREYCFVIQLDDAQMNALLLDAVGSRYTLSIKAPGCICYRGEVAWDYLDVSACDTGEGIKIDVSRGIIDRYYSAYYFHVFPCDPGDIVWKLSRDFKVPRSKVREIVNKAGDASPWEIWEWFAFRRYELGMRVGETHEQCIFDHCIPCQARKIIGERT